MNRFDGRSVLVTGAAGGMGRAIAAGFAREGAHVTVADIDEDGAAATVEEIRGSGGTATHVRTDVADATSVAEMVQHAVSAYGGLDCAVNAAAIEGEGGVLHELDDEVFDRMMAVNTRSVFLCMKHELRAMLGRDGDRAIVNIASTNSYRPQPHQSAYTASKFAVLGITKAAAIDYAPLGIRINAICPGAIDTPMLRNAMARRGRDEAGTIARLSLIGRFGEPREIADAALWLCSPEASFTIGHALAVDGGYLAR